MAEGHPRAAFRHPAFRRFQVAKVLGVIAVLMISVGVGWQIYEITGRPLDIGLVGLVQFVPQLLLFPVTGAIVDRFDHKRIVLVCYALYALSAVALAVLALGRPDSPLPIYAVLVLFAVARSLSSPAHSAILAQLVPHEDFGNAVTWSSSLWSIGAIAGPAVGGAVYGIVGEAWAVYGVAAAIFVVCFGGVLTVFPRPARRAPVGTTWHHFFTGLRFISRRPIVFSAILLDLFAVLFGGAVALLPFYVGDILAGGPEELGLLRSAPSVGAAGMAVFLSYRTLGRRAGVKLLVAVGVFGVATIVFALSRTFWLSFVALVVTGLADEVSVVIRSNLSQLSTPEHMRGRVSAAEFVFIGMSNEIGELESGTVAQAIGPVGAALLGGIGSLVVVAVAAVAAPALRKVDRLTLEELGPHNFPDDDR
jgi:MFS family permease